MSKCKDIEMHEKVICIKSQTGNLAEIMCKTRPCGQNWMLITCKMSAGSPNYSQHGALLLKFDESKWKVSFKQVNVN